jgi:hypothetical protein
MMPRAQVIAAIVTASLASSAIACDCLPAAGYTDKDITNVLAKADAVVHAKVVSLAANGEARILIFESFKGQLRTLKAQSGNHGNCGTSFQTGEEAIYVVYSGEVSLCGKLPAKPELVRRLRAYKR